MTVGKPRQYPDIIPNISAYFIKQNINLQHLTLDDLAVIDQFHIGGRPSTRQLAEMTEIPIGTTILDIGCGIGGPARVLAGDYSTRVIGVDLSADYCRVAGWLNRMVKLDDHILIINASGEALPFADDVFDIVWLQHLSMNIKDKASFFSDCHRVLKDDGKIALHEVVRTGDHDIAYPVFWAESADNSFLQTEDEMKQTLRVCGFRQKHWRTTTGQAVAGFTKMVAGIADGTFFPGLSVYVERVPEKAKNMLENLSGGKIEVIQSVWEIV